MRSTGQAGTWCCSDDGPPRAVPPTAVAGDRPKRLWAWNGPTPELLSGSAGQSLSFRARMSRSAVQAHDAPKRPVSQVPPVGLALEASARPCPMTGDGGSGVKRQQETRTTLTGGTTVKPVVSLLSSTQPESRNRVGNLHVLFVSLALHGHICARHTAEVSC